jgi:hypothetical protein
MRFLAGHGFKLLLGGRRLPDGAAFQRALAIDFGRRGIYLDAIVFCLQFVLISPDNVLSIMSLAVPIWPQECLKGQRDGFVGRLNWSQISLSLGPKLNLVSTRVRAVRKASKR